MFEFAGGRISIIFCTVTCFCFGVSADASVPAVIAPAAFPSSVDFHAFAGGDRAKGGGGSLRILSSVPKLFKLLHMNCSVCPTTRRVPGEDWAAVEVEGDTES